jgi:hypothetical protein
MAEPAPDLFAAAGASVDPDVLAGLELLAGAPPLWPIGTQAWAELVGRVTTFAHRWDSQARGFGWSTLSLYGQHPAAPSACLSCMGGAFVLARSQHRAVAIDGSAIAVVAPTGSRLRIYKGELQGAVVAWDFRRESR